MAIEERLGEAPPFKAPVNAMFDVDVVKGFKSQDRGYQARMNAVLRRTMEVHRKAGTRVGKRCPMG